MFIGISDIFKIGIGPSSSHTMGPMVAAHRFVRNAKSEEQASGAKIAHITVRLHGSLAFTGKGHASDRAIYLGLLGYLPDTIMLDDIPVLEDTLFREKYIQLDEVTSFRFDPQTDLIFDYEEALPAHANGMQFFCYDEDDGLMLHEIYYSIGGGFIRRSDEMEQQADIAKTSHPHNFTNAKQMLAMAQETGMSIAQMQYENELAYRDKQRVDQSIAAIESSMFDCIERGLSQTGILPGGLNVKRRAKAIHEQLIQEQHNNDKQPHVMTDWLSVYAMAVNEENAAGGRIVTSPTNGAAGVIPAVMRYYKDHCHGAHDEGLVTLLLTAAAIGMIIKTNASISGAEVGCQGEVGSASAMAAAGLCAALGGTNEQIENAAEIALEHHLGMTCDPAGGLVQVPCIERNGLGAIKAVSAASLALRGDGTHFIPLDNCIETMRQTGIDMHERYKETSNGGLAVNLPEC
ncbi:MAG: L-serine ammonia-lyase [Candidatus Puniceispirillaceae bacterium]